MSKKWLLTHWRCWNTDYYHGTLQHRKVLTVSCPSWRPPWPPWAPAPVPWRAPSWRGVVSQAWAVHSAGQHCRGPAACAPCKHDVNSKLFNQWPNLQNILRQSYDYLMITPKLRSTYSRRLIHKTSYEGRKAFLRYNSLAKSSEIVFVH